VSAAASRKPRIPAASISTSISERALASMQPLPKPHQGRAGAKVRAVQDFLPIDSIALRDGLKHRELGERHDSIGAGLGR